MGFLPYLFTGLDWPRILERYARYEQGKSVPTVEKLNQLMRAIDPSFEPVLKVALMPGSDLHYGSKRTSGDSV